MIEIRMSARGNCVRRIGYEQLGYEGKPPSAESQVVMGMGNVAEIAILPMLRERGYEIEGGRDVGEQKEVVIEDGEIKYVGHPDGVITAPGRKRLLEVKSTNPRSYARVKSEGPAAATPQYLHQVDGYMMALDLDKAEFWFINRVNGEHFNWPINFDQDRFDKRHSQLINAASVIEKGELPEPEYDGSGWHCSPAWCPFSGICPSGQKWAEQKAEVVATADEPLEGFELATLERLAEEWVAAREIEDQVKAATEDAKTAFRITMQRRGLKELAVGGVRAKMKGRNVPYYAVKELEANIPMEVLAPYRKIRPDSWIELKEIDGE